MGETTDRILSLLQKHKFFKGLDQSEIERIVSYAEARVKTVDRDEVVLHMGDRLRSVILVISGRLNVVQQTRDGSELIDITVISGGMVGSTFALAQGEQFPRMIVAAEESELVFFNLGRIRDLLKDSKNRQLLENFYQFLAGNLMRCMEKFAVIGCWEIGDKVLTYLERIAATTGSREVKIPFRTSAEFAQYLGVNRCALSRSLSQLERRGVLTHRSGKFILLGGSPS